jgi:hypothetical protein
MCSFVATRLVAQKMWGILWVSVSNVDKFRRRNNALGGVFGGAEGNRTPDLCSAIAALSHLSYGPGGRAI